jgi:hypothetical protein
MMFGHRPRAGGVRRKRMEEKKRTRNESIEIQNRPTHKIDLQRKKKK